MFYQSTRSSLRASDLEAVLQGLAADGGLYIDPDIRFRPFDWEKCLGVYYLHQCVHITLCICIEDKDTIL